MQARKLSWLAAASCAVVFATPLTAQADRHAFPERPVTLTVPFPAGGTTDILARLLAAELADAWKQPVIVENKGGASGTIFSEQLTRMTPDGYNLMLTATHHVINPSLYTNLRYDTRTDFTPIAQIAAVPNVLVAHPSFAPNSVTELIEYAKANPGKVDFGSAGIGGANHLSGELFKSMAQVDMMHVPYKGAAPALNDLLGGQIPIMFDSVPGVVSHIEAGNLKALGVTSAERSDALPNVPTIAEAGLPGFEATAWFGLYAPPGMSPELAEKVSASVREALQAPRIQEQLAKLGAHAGTMTQVEFADFVNDEIDKWETVIREADIKMD